MRLFNNIYKIICFLHKESKLSNVRTLDNVLVIPNSDLSYVRSLGWRPWVLLVVYTTGKIIVVGRRSSVRLFLTYITVSILALVIAATTNIIIQCIVRWLGGRYGIMATRWLLLLLSTIYSAATVIIVVVADHSRRRLRDATAAGY